MDELCHMCSQAAGLRDKDMNIQGKVRKERMKHNDLLGPWHHPDICHSSL